MTYMPVMTYMPASDRPPTPRERSYLEALASGDRRPSISGQAGHMCRKFGWCEVVYIRPDGSEVTRSALPPSMDSIAVVRAGYRAVGYLITVRGRAALGHPAAGATRVSPPSLPAASQA